MIKEFAQSGMTADNMKESDLSNMMSQKQMMKFAKKFGKKMRF